MMETLKEKLKRHEGFQGEMYRCPAGRWTIGWGHQIQIPCIVSRQEADLLLDEDIHRAEFEYISLGWTLDPARKDVIVEMIFWMGLGGVLKFKKMIRAIEQEDWSEASRQMMDSQAGRNYAPRMSQLAEVMRDG